MGRKVKHSPLFEKGALMNDPRLKRFSELRVGEFYREEGSCFVRQKIGEERYFNVECKVTGCSRKDTLCLPFIVTMDFEEPPLPKPKRFKVGDIFEWECGWGMTKGVLAEVEAGQTTLVLLTSIEAGKAWHYEPISSIVPTEEEVQKYLSVGGPKDFTHIGHISNLKELL